MKFKEYVEGLVAALKDNPAIGEYDAIYSRDDEGNSYQFVNYNTCLVGVYDGNSFSDAPEYYCSWSSDSIAGDKTPNAVCIN